MLEYKTMSMCGSSDYCRGWNDAVKEMPRWISVKERMPEEKQHSCNGVKGAPHSKLYLVVVRDPFGESTRVQTDMTLNGKWYSYGCDITHWMPLPDAPEVEDD